MNLGDIVYLKSGSRPMTVTKIDSDSGREEATCDWDGGSKRFPVEALVSDDPVPALDSARRQRQSALFAEEQALPPAPVEADVKA